MPRRSGGGAGRAPSRPTAAPARSSVPQQQSRPATTAAYPGSQTRTPATTQQQGQQQGSAGPGLFGQMASTAAGVAVGSSIGHAIGGFFGGGSSAPVESQTNAVGNQEGSYGSAMTNSSASQACGEHISSFRNCMNENGSDLNVCGWYLDQLKACQQAAGRY